MLKKKCFNKIHASGKVENIFQLRPKILSNPVTVACLILVGGLTYYPINSAYAATPAACTNIASGSLIISAGTYYVARCAVTAGLVNSLVIEKNAEIVSTTTGIVNGATIQFGGAATGVNSPYNLDILNQGIVRSTGAIAPAIKIETGVGKTAVGNIVNDVNAEIISDQYGGIDFYSGALNGNIINKGKISGAGGGSIIISAALNGDIINSSTGSIVQDRMVAGNYNVGVLLYADSRIKNIVNQGKIVSKNNILSSEQANAEGAGIKLEKNPQQYRPILTGNIVNTGLIQADNIGIYVKAGKIEGDIINSGTISGGVAAIQVDQNNLSQMLGSIVIQGNDTAKFIGKVNATGVPVVIDKDSVYTLLDQQNFNVHGFTNEGILKTAGGTAKIKINGAGGFFNMGNMLMKTSSMVDVTGKFTNTGYLSLDASSTVKVTESLFNTGKLLLASESSVDVMGTFTNTGDLLLDTRSTVKVTESLSNTGKLLLAAGSSMGVTGGFSNVGSLSIDAGSSVNVTGDFSNVGGSLQVGVNGNDGRYGQLSSSGVATLTGSILQVNASNIQNLKGHTLSNVLQANAIDGQFSGAVEDNSFLFDFVPVYGAKTVDLSIKPALTAADVVAMLSGAGYSGAEGAGKTVATLLSDMQNPVTQTFLRSQVNSQAATVNAIAQTLPALAGGLQQGSLGGIREIQRTVETRQGAQPGKSSGDTVLGDWQVWIKSFRAQAKQGAQAGNVPGFTASSRGLTIGAEAQLSNATRVGAALGWGNMSMNSDSTLAPSQGRTDMYTLMGYGSYAVDAKTTLNVRAGWGVTKNRSNRQIKFVNKTAEARFRGAAIFLGADVSRVYPISPRARFVPSLRADYLQIRDKGYTETGADALNLVAQGGGIQQLLLGAHAKLDYDLSANTVLTANVGADYDAMKQKTQVTSAYQGAPAVTFKTDGIGRDPITFKAGIGLERALKKGVSVRVRYDAEYNRKNYRNQAITAQLRWVF